VNKRSPKCVKGFIFKKAWNIIWCMAGNGPFIHSIAQAYLLENVSMKAAKA
jgi:hypothetical protein